MFLKLRRNVLSLFLADVKKENFKLKYQKGSLKEKEWWFSTCISL